MSTENEPDVYTRLALLLGDVVWGWLDHVPGSGVLHDILRQNFSEEEALALSHIPMKPIPLDFTTLDEIAASSGLLHETLERTLDGIAARGLLYRREMSGGKKGYALLKLAFGYPQVFYWKGDKTPHARKMIELQSQPEHVKAQIDMYTGTETKPFRYIPTTEAIDPQWQNVYPAETIEKVILRATRIAVAHCPCRIRNELLTGKPCGHSTEVCIKLDDLAEVVVAAGLAREIDHEEALQVIKKAQAEGLVHFTDNAGEGIKHICNCCGDVCWNVGPIRRRKYPRDLLMATYFLRETDEDACIACENCVDICPVNAVSIVDDVARVDHDWCIGCGVCVPRCSAQAIRLVEKQPKPKGSADFAALHLAVHHERATHKASGQAVGSKDTDATGARVT
ncbi:MAG: 4Fe-4S binding protein [Chloroflexi bacterium]|nr:4Fe-4S binding protein [Chloroflexota bacterium]